MLKELLLPEIEDLIEQNQWEDISEIINGKILVKYYLSGKKRKLQI